MPPINASVTNQQITASVGETQIDVAVSGGFGPSGAAATITVGTVTTGAAGSSATVTNVGTQSAAVLNFVIPAGATGVQGVQGAKGDAGDVGPAGAKGDRGDAGAQGPAGAKGDRGDAGAQGPAGVAGAQGPKGDAGDVGPAGAKGDRGDAGAQGPAGVAGAQGPAGVAGPAGAQGPAGAKGDRGDAGAQGPAGATGPAGTTSWSGITDKPATFAPSSHSHSIADVTGLQTALDGKASTSDARLNVTWPVRAVHVGGVFKITNGTGGFQWLSPAFPAVDFGDLATLATVQHATESVTVNLSSNLASALAANPGWALVRSSLEIALIDADNRVVGWGTTESDGNYGPTNGNGGHVITVSVGSFPTIPPAHKLEWVLSDDSGTFADKASYVVNRPTPYKQVAHRLLDTGKYAWANITDRPVISGANTGDQTITLTGDVTGSGTGSFAATLSNTGVSAGTFTSVTVDSKGRVTAGSSPAVAYSSLSGTPATFPPSDHTHISTAITNAVGSPTVLSASQNNYTLPAADIVRLAASSAVDITGFVATSGGDARLLVNVGANTITLRSDSASSTAANRLRAAGGDFSLVAGGSVAVIYDGTDSVWRVAAAALSASDITGTLSDDRLSSKARAAVNVYLWSSFR